jgi:hydroxymethylpyrimidine pyrophosphatase-like HAD family hydrolase
VQEKHHSVVKSLLRKRFILCVLRDAVKIKEQDGERQNRKRMRELGLVFTVTSGRPPHGLRMPVEALGLTMPMAAFNGGVIVLPDLSVLDEKTLPDYILPAIVETIESRGLDVWLYSATDWYVHKRQSPRARRCFSRNSGRR